MIYDARLSLTLWRGILQMLKVAKLSVFLLFLGLCTGWTLVAAADETARTDLGWSNTTDLSLVVTAGNSDTETFGFNDRLRRRWQRGLFELKLDGTKSDTADDRYRQVAAGVEWLPGDQPAAGYDTFLVIPEKKPDVEKYSIETSYTRTITPKTYWNTGTRWDRDVDAGLINRYQGYFTFGNNWYDREDLKFNTGYGLSYTDREEETPDPEKDENFAGARLNLYYMNQFNERLSYENDWSFNLNLTDSSDYATDMTQSFSVTMTTHLSLKVSLQWLYNNEPALEDIDLVALDSVDLQPCTDDPTQDCFVTVGSGGAEIVLGEVQERKDSLDTVFRTSLSINF